MRSHPLRSLAFVSGLVLALVAGAAVGGAAATWLTPGGNTRGGPVDAALAEGEIDRPFELLVERLVCLSVENSGKAALAARILFPGTVAEITIAGGATGTVCGSGMGGGVECLGPGSCKYTWRFDRP